jgi:DNA-binding transcriptional LysR family regulator
MTLDRFCNARHLHISPAGLAQGAVDEALAAIGRHRNVVLTVNQFFTAGRVVAQSDLLMALPMSFVGATGYEHAFAVRPLPIEVGKVHIDMLWHARNDASPPHRWLLERLRDASRLTFAAPH